MGLWLSRLCSNDDSEDSDDSQRVIYNGATFVYDNDKEVLERLNRDQGDNEEYYS